MKRGGEERQSQLGGFIVVGAGSDPYIGLMSLTYFSWMWKFIVVHERALYHSFVATIFRSFLVFDLQSSLEWSVEILD